MADSPMTGTVRVFHGVSQSDHRDTYNITRGGWSGECFSNTSRGVMIHETEA